MTSPASDSARISARRVSFLSLAGLFMAWLVLQFGGLFSPGLLDDVDSIYIQIAREMLQRHDFVTPTIDGIRFFDKPPLMFWMAAGSMRLFGYHDWAARIPLALGVLALLFAVYFLGRRLYAHVSPADRPDRAGFYAALALATSVGPYLYTRFYIPDILIALWMTLCVHLFLIALDRVHARRSALLPMAAFGAVTALSVLTKGLIGAVFPFGFALLYLLASRQFRLFSRLNPLAAIASFLLVAGPWHLLAALRNPPIPMPPGLGLPPRAGWAWFYLYNEHIARFLSRRIPHDYGQVPIPLFWALLFLWLIPWSAFLPNAVLDAIRQLRAARISALRFDPDAEASPQSLSPSARSLSGFEQPSRTREAALATLLWAGLVLGFFTLSARQEYYHIPALPALALLSGALLAAADRKLRDHAAEALPNAAQQCLRASRFVLVPLGLLLFLVCAYFALTAQAPAPGSDLNHLLSSNPEMYNLSLGHVFDLTSEAMGFFRGPLLTVAVCMLFLGPGSHFLRRTGRTLLANVIVAAGMCGVLLAAHEGLARFYPILGSKDLALAVNAARKPGDLILIDGELTAGSTLIFYTGQQAHLVNGRINGPWFGSFYPDAPAIFENNDSLHHLWSSPTRIFLLTYDQTRRTTDLTPYGPVHPLASSGGKTILTNR